MVQTLSNQTTEQSFMGLGLKLAECIVWCSESIACSCEQSGYAGCVACEAKRLAKAMVALCPDSFGYKAVVPPTNEGETEKDKFRRTYPLHLAYLMMRYPEKAPRIVVPEDPWAKKPFEDAKPAANDEGVAENVVGEGG